MFSRDQPGSRPWRGRWTARASGPLSGRRSSGSGFSGWQDPLGEEAIWATLWPGQKLLHSRRFGSGCNEKENLANTAAELTSCNELFFVFTWTENIDVKIFYIKYKKDFTQNIKNILHNIKKSHLQFLKSRFLVFELSAKFSCLTRKEMQKKCKRDAKDTKRGAKDRQIHLKVLIVPRLTLGSLCYAYGWISGDCSPGNASIF